jgi:DNA helicase-2/ATP-dependent DNA helicase PcrA
MAKTDSKRGPAYLRGLTRRQRRAVRHGLENGPSPNISPALVIAGAGTGKTKTLVHRVAHLIVKGMDPQRILLLTFSRCAAHEMTSRVKDITEAALGGRQTEHPWSGTFHGIGAQLVREYASYFGLPSSFTILDPPDAADLMNLVRQDLGFSTRKSPFPTKGTCLAIYSYMTNSEMRLRQVLSGRFKPCLRWKRELRNLFRCYSDAKRRQHVVDYDDLLLYWARLMADPKVGDEIRRRFDHVLVDEYQDTNPLQARILFMLRPKGRGLTVVGDDAQAIYSFRAATVRNIIEFPDQCRPRARVIALEENFRSTQPILEAANKVIGLAKERYTKQLFSKRRSEQKPCLTIVRDGTEQAKYVAQQMIDAREAGVPLKSQAVLFRASGYSHELELELARRNIPFVKYGGLKFLEAAHVKDIISLLRWAENPRDRVAGFRALQLMPGIGPGTAAKILKETDRQGPHRRSVAKMTVPPAARSHWRGFMRLVGDIRRGKAAWPAELQLVRKWYEPLLHDNYDDDAIRRLPDIAQLEQVATGYASRRQFLTDLALDPPEGTSASSKKTGRKEDYAVLSTIHSAKGQEWRIVRILNVTDGCIPSDQAEDVEEERRLLHLAMTRAKNELDLIVPERFFRYQNNNLNDRYVYGSVSRFIPASLRDAFDCRRWRDREDKRSILIVSR